MKKLIPQDVDIYIAKAAPESQPLLQALRELIKQSVPDVEEGTWYGVPFYRFYGQLVGFAAYKKHVSVGFGADVIENKDRHTLEQEGYKVGIGTIQIRYDQKVPVTILEKILKEKAATNDSQKIVKG